MAITSFDTLAVSRSLEQDGFTREQAEALSQSMRESFQLIAEDRQLATKQDLANLKHDLEVAMIGLENRLGSKIHGLENKLEGKMHGLENKLESEMHELKNNMAEERLTMIKWTMTGMLAQMALLVEILSYLK